MQLSQIFKQAMLGLIITAAIAPAAHAQKPAPATENHKCQVTVSEESPLHYSIIDSFPTLHVYDYDTQTIHSTSARNGTEKKPLAKLKAADLKKYEEMKRRLSPACKTKLGIR